MTSAETNLSDHS